MSNGGLLTQRFGAKALVYRASRIALNGQTRDEALCAEVLHSTLTTFPSPLKRQ